MSTSTVGGTPAVHAAGRAPQPGLPAQFRNALTAEWIKLRSVRSTLWVLLLTVAVCVGFSVLQAIANTQRWDSMGPQERAHFHAASNSVAGVFFGQLIIGCLGVLAMSAEYTTGTIRATITATPQRVLAFLAKIGVFTVVAGIVAVFTTLTSFFVAQAIFSSKHADVGLTDGENLRVVLGAAVFLVGVALIGLGFAAVLRHTAGAVSSLFGILLVLPILMNFLPEDWANAIMKWLPLQLGLVMIRTGESNSNAFAPWTGMALLYGYAALALAAGAVLLVRRDA